MCQITQSGSQSGWELWGGGGGGRGEKGGILNNGGRYLKATAGRRVHPHGKEVALLKITESGSQSGRKRYLKVTGVGGWGGEGWCEIKGKR